MIQRVLVGLALIAVLGATYFFTEYKAQPETAQPSAPPPPSGDDAVLQNLKIN